MAKSTWSVSISKSLCNLINVFDSTRFWWSSFKKKKAEHLFSLFFSPEMFDKQQANSIFWSPQGQFLVLAGLRRSVLECNYISKLFADVQVINQFENKTCRWAVEGSWKGSTQCVNPPRYWKRTSLPIANFNHPVSCWQYERCSGVCRHLRLHHDEHCWALHGLWCGMGPNWQICGHLCFLVEPQGKFSEGVQCDQLMGGNLSFSCFLQLNTRLLQM